MSMLEGEIGKWLKNEGEQVNEGEDLVEIIDNKATHTVQAMVSGTLEEIIVDEGETAEVGATIAIVTD
jgi:pyruvate/2-oxoglutarate dehydrogenase complex dihydrolipoamide acyltransferase (E2) component